MTAATEVRRIRILSARGRSCRWRDAVTGETRESQIGTDVDATLLVEGRELLVRLERRGLHLVVVSVVGERAPGPDRAAREPEPEPMWTPRAAERTVPRVGEVRTARYRMDPRSTADRDAGRDQKRRPAVVVSVDDDARQVELRWVFGTNSAPRREGRARRLKAWREAGLRKPSVVGAEVHVRTFDELGPVIGRLSPGDAEWAISLGWRPRSEPA